MLLSLYLTAQQERHGKTRSLNSSKAVMARYPQLKTVSIGGKGIVGYLPEAVGFSLGAAEGHGALDFDGNDQEEDSSIVWNNVRLEEDSMSDSGK